MYRKYFKPLMDFLISALALIVLFPILLLIGLYIKSVSKGPMIFVQQRLGLNKRIFKMYKFRTMHVNSNELRSADGSYIVKKNDPRLIPGAVFLRKGFDELPQLINILLGQMSFVGPRPDLPDIADILTAEESVRYTVKPGLSNLPAISGRNDLPLKQRLKLDIQYVAEQSFWMDVKIIFFTIVLILGIKSGKLVRYQ